VDRERSPRGTGCSALALALALTAWPALSQDAEALFREGAAAHDRGELELARAKYAEAFRLRPSVEVAANLGVVEGQLRLHRDAAEHLAFALARYPEGADPEKRRRMSEELSRVLGYVGTLRVVAPAGARVEVDGREVGTAPLLAPVYVEPGSHSLRALAAEGGVIVPLPPHTVSVQAGESRDVDLGAPTPPGATPPATPTDGATPPRGGPRTDPVLVVGGAGLALFGAGLGLTFTVMSSSAGSDADAATAELTRGGINRCLRPSPPGGCAAVQSDLEARDGLRTAAAVSFVAAGTLALGTVAYVIVTSADGEPADQVSLRIAPAVGPDRRGLTAWGTF
jgi:hypothetical protein